MEKKISFYEFKVTDSSQNIFDFSTLKHKTVLIVNVASKCGFTNQYKGLEELYQKYKSKDFIILGFPCNQFGAQEPGSDSEIQNFCSLTYQVTFPVLSKIDVNGPNTSPVFQFLKEQAPGLLGTESIKWNFTKFLISKNGDVLKRFAPNTEPVEIATDIDHAIHL